MVSAEARWVLGNTKADPKNVAKAFGIEEGECWEYLEDLNRSLAEAEATYERPRSELRDLPEAKEIRRQVLLEKLRIAKLNPKAYDHKRLMNEYRALTSGALYTQADVERARRFPITKLIEHRHNMARCPFHDDKTASLNLKNNFYYCHGCQASGDVIDFAMKTKNLTFKEALAYLT